MGDQNYKTRKEIELSSADEFGLLVASLEKDMSTALREDASADVLPSETPMPSNAYRKSKTARFEDKPEDRSNKYTTLGEMLFGGIM